MNDELDRNLGRAAGAALDGLAHEASNLRHEIKNPVSSIRLAVGALADQLGESRTAVLGDLCARLDRVAQRLEEFATLACVGQDELATADLRPALVAIADRVRRAGGSADPVEIELDLPETCVAFADQAALRRFVACLVAARVDQGHRRLCLTWRASDGGGRLLELASAGAPGASDGAEPAPPLSAPLELTGELLAQASGTRWRRSETGAVVRDELTLPYEPTP